MAIFNRLNLFETINYYQRRTENNYYRWCKLPLQFINKRLPGTHSNQTQTHHGNNHNRGNQIKTNSLINYTIILIEPNAYNVLICLLLLKKNNGETMISNQINCFNHSRIARTQEVACVPLYQSRRSLLNSKSRSRALSIAVIGNILMCLPSRTRETPT